MLQWQSWLEAWQRIVVVIRDWNSPAAILNPSVRTASPSELRLHPTTARILRTLSVASCSESANFAFVEVHIPNLTPSHVTFFPDLLQIYVLLQTTFHALQVQMLEILLRTACKMMVRLLLFRNFSNFEAWSQLYTQADS